MLELDPGLLVAPERDEDVADRGACLGRRVAELERRAEVGQGLGVGEQPSRPHGGAPRPRRGLVRAAGRREVAGDHARRCRGRVPVVPAGERLGGAAVEEAPACPARVLVDDPAEGVVGEGVGRVVAGRGGRVLLQQPAAQRLVERVGGLVLIAPARRPQQVGVEPSAEDRGCGERLRGGLRDAGDPGAEQLADARRQRPDPVARPGICRPERVDVGREQERQAPGLVDQPPDVDPRARQARRVEQRRRLLGAEGRGRASWASPLRWAASSAARSPSGGPESRSQVSTARSGSSASRRTRKANSCAEASSAQWTSSTTTAPVVPGALSALARASPTAW